MQKTHELGLTPQNALYQVMLRVDSREASPAILKEVAPELTQILDQISVSHRHALCEIYDKAGLHDMALQFAANLPSRSALEREERAKTVADMRRYYAEFLEGNEENLMELYRRIERGLARDARINAEGEERIIKRCVFLSVQMSLAEARAGNTQALLQVVNATTAGHSYSGIRGMLYIIPTEELGTTPEELNKLRSFCDREGATQALKKTVERLRKSDYTRSEDAQGDLDRINNAVHTNMQFSMEQLGLTYTEWEVLKELPRIIRERNFVQDTLRDTLRMNLPHTPINFGLIVRAREVSERYGFEKMGTTQAVLEDLEVKMSYILARELVRELLDPESPGLKDMERDALTLIFQRGKVNMKFLGLTEAEHEELRQRVEAPVEPERSQ